MFAPGSPIQNQNDLIGEMFSGFFFKLTQVLKCIDAASLAKSVRSRARAHDLKPT
jgi:hypothetical protein